MKEHQVSADWSTSRGDKWCANAERMEAMLAPVDEPLIHALHLDKPYRIADLGCGGGATSREILRRAPAGTVVHGFDISAELIAFARRKQPASSGISFEVVDIATASPPGGPYDRLVSRASTMFFENPLSAFANLLGWLAPDGRFAFAVWGPPEQNPSGIIREVVDQVVGLPPMVPDAPGPFRYANVQDLIAVLDRVGYTDLHSTHWHGLLPVGGGMGAAEAARFVLASFSNFAEVLAAAGLDASARACELLIDRFSPHEQDGIVRLAASAHIVTGRGK